MRAGSGIRERRGAIAVLLASLCAAGPLLAADTKTGKDRKLGWFNATELSAVVTSGNSASRTYGAKNTLRRVWEDGRLKISIDYLRIDTTDDRYLLVNPGYEFPPGGEPTDPGTTLVKPPVKPDVEKIFVGASYDRDISKKLFWNVGASWDRNADAGILNRYIGYAGVGNTWSDRDDLHFTTSYGASYTDREEDQPDPLKNPTFAGARVASDLLMKMSATTTFEDNITANMSLADFSDYSFGISNSLSVTMGAHVSLKVSLEWLFNNVPALEDVDVIARVVLVDPDGVPGSGDEYFHTVSSGGSEVKLGEGRARKEQLDTVFRTTLVIDF